MAVGRNFKAISGPIGINTKPMLRERLPNKTTMPTIVSVLVRLDDAITRRDNYESHYRPVRRRSADTHSQGNKEGEKGNQ